MSGVTRRLRVVDDTAMDTLLKVAFATADRRSVDQHFGSARSFVIVGVNPEQSRLLSVCEFTEFGADTSEDKLAAKLDLLDGCIAVYCRACGASAVRQLLGLGIQPVKVTEGALIDDLLDALKQELREGPSAWLAKAIRQQMLPPGPCAGEAGSDDWNDEG
jgi:nitrogen fixation protein NifX